MRWVEEGFGSQVGEFGLYLENNEKPSKCFNPGKISSDISIHSLQCEQLIEKGLAHGGA